MIPYGMKYAKALIVNLDPELERQNMEKSMLTEIRRLRAVVRAADEMRFFMDQDDIGRYHREAIAHYDALRLTLEN